MENIKKDINGHFDGQNMQGDDGNIYPIPANYASKSRLVDGDILVLKMTPDGRYMFKQVNIHPRMRIIAEIIKSDEGMLVALHNGKEYMILEASLSFYKLKEGDKVTLLIPVGKDTNWGAVEHVVIN